VDIQTDRNTDNSIWSYSAAERLIIYILLKYYSLLRLQQGYMLYIKYFLFGGVGGAPEELV